MLVALIFAAATACNDDGPGRPPPGSGGGMMGTDNRVVVAVDGLIGDSHDGGRVIPGPRDANANEDAPVVDADVGDVATADVGGAMDAASACSLTQQDCPNAQGCYPLANGTVACVTRGAVPENGPCTETTQCDRGLVCAADAVAGAPPSCYPICSTVQSACPGSSQCISIPTHPAFGYCSP